jgi:hypothetical protein
MIDPGNFAHLIPAIETGPRFLGGKFPVLPFLGNSPVHFSRTRGSYCRLSQLPSRWAYYDQQRQRGNKFHEAVRALAYKWIRIIYQCWRQRAPYNEDVYLARLELHGSLLAKLVASDGCKNQELS